jgi:mRNA interferase HigB
VKSTLDAWFHEVEAASWKNPAEVKAAYANASIVGGNRVVFNIKGNSFRLVIAADYARQVVFIKWIERVSNIDGLDSREPTSPDFKTLPETTGNVENHL